MGINLNSHSYEQPQKQAIFMRHGRVGRSPGRNRIYSLLHNTKELLRGFPLVRSLSKYSTVKRGISSVDEPICGFLDAESNYEELSNRKFMQLMLHQIDLPLADKDNCIDVEKLPSEIDVIFHSPARRSIETAQYIRDALGGTPRIDSSLTRQLAEVKFSENIVTEKEYKELAGLAGCRNLVLERWYYGHYGQYGETLQDSLDRAEQLRETLISIGESRVLLITHGWYLRLLHLVFFCGRTSFSFDELKETTPLKYGEYFQVPLALGATGIPSRERPDQIHPMSGVSAQPVPLWP